MTPDETNVLRDLNCKRWLTATDVAIRCGARLPGNPQGGH